MIDLLMFSDISFSSYIQLLMLECVRYAKKLLFAEQLSKEINKHKKTTKYWIQMLILRCALNDWDYFRITNDY